MVQSHVQWSRQMAVNANETFVCFDSFDCLLNEIYDFRDIFFNLQVIENVQCSVDINLTPRGVYLVHIVAKNQKNFSDALTYRLSQKITKFSFYFSALKQVIATCSQVKSYRHECRASERETVEISHWTHVGCFGMLLRNGNVWKARTQSGSYIQNDIKLEQFRRWRSDTCPESRPLLYRIHLRILPFGRLKIFMLFVVCVANFKHYVQ